MDKRDIKCRVFTAECKVNSHATDCIFAENIVNKELEDLQNKGNEIISISHSSAMIIHKSETMIIKFVVLYRKSLW